MTKFECNLPAGSASTDALERARVALSFLSPNCPRDEWVFIGMGVHDELGEAGWSIFDEWSAGGDSYKASTARDVWKSFKQGGGKGFGYVVDLAKREGFDAKVKGYTKPTPEQVAEREAKHAERQKVHAAEEAIEEAEAAIRAQKRLDAAVPATDDYPYLKKKGVKAHDGLRVGSWWKWDPVTDSQIELQNTLLLPVKDVHGKIWSLQGITENGDKYLLSGGAKKGKFLALGKPKPNAEGNLVYGFAEGYATAASAHELTGIAVLCCFDVGNMVRLVREVREKKPAAELIIFADNDTKTEAKRRGNPGMKAAFRIGMEYDAAVVFAPGGGDFNDLVQEHGEEAAKAAFDARVVPTAPYAPLLPADGLGATGKPQSAAQVRAAISDEMRDDDEALEPAVVCETDRPVIMIERNNVKAINDQAENALVTACPFLYSRGGEIVRPMVAMAPDGRGGAVRTIKIRSLKRAALHEHLDAAACWMKYDGRSKSDVPIDAPMTVADALLGRGASSLRPLTGVIEAPTLRADGSILDVPGYDAETGLLFLPNCDYPPVPQYPGRAEALAAIQRIEALIDKYPYVAPVDRSVALAAILTCSVRRALNKAPMFAVNAPTPGSGKSALIDVACIIVTGSTVPVFAQGENEAEFEKRLHGALLAGHSVVSFDNVTRPIEGNALCQAMTQQTMEVRPLGTSDTRTVPTSTTFFATGNGLVVRADMTRRVLECQLDPGVERPELRVFDFDPLEVAKAQRATVLVDALTVLRAHRLAQHEVRSRRIDFNEWSAMVADALVWLGYADPAASMDRTRASDPAKDEFRAVAREWTKHFGSKLASVREAIEAATEQSGGSFGTRAEFMRPDFREALLQIAGAGGAINSRSLGKWLAKHVKFLVDGLTVHKAEGAQGVQRWGFGQAVLANDASPPL
ncbi:PriCT-2 domain-containing protein [Variovorax sp. LT2P21]|uniref:PriCT-2 domain-containing protein n=1 Tax=Variovorax sp. LT2P21 TaxID=3443731 RepID=UPI003F482188